jgi:uncharacterized membrane protein YbhN (UPF0104 family)
MLITKTTTLVEQLSDWAAGVKWEELPDAACFSQYLVTFFVWLHSIFCMNIIFLHYESRFLHKK